MKEMEKKKQLYFPPAINIVRLDNEISLALESNPPGGDGETKNLYFERNNNDPFNAQLV